ncbi:Zinc finger E-box-binding homeobox 2, partial [Massospora cicadina]
FGMKKCIPTRVRTKFTKEQLNELESLYAFNTKPSKDLMLELGHRAGLELRIIQVWFQNRRVKERNQQLAQFEPPLPTHPSLSHLVDLMHMPTCDLAAYPTPPVVPSSQLLTPPLTYPQGVYNNPIYLQQNYCQYLADLNQSLII